MLNESLEDTENLPAPEVLAAEIAENLQSALEQFNSMREELDEDKSQERAWAYHDERAFSE